MMWVAGSHHDIGKLDPNLQEVHFSHVDAFRKLPHRIIKAELVARLVPTAKRLLPQGRAIVCMACIDGLCHIDLNNS